MAKCWMDVLNIYKNYSYENLSIGDKQRICEILDKYKNIENGCEIIENRIKETIEHFEKIIKENEHKVKKLKEFLEHSDFKKYFEMQESNND